MYPEGRVRPCMDLVIAALFTALGLSCNVQTCIVHAWVVQVRAGRVSFPHAGYQ